MGFWIFMLVMVWLIPVMMLGFGALFRRRPPRNVNYWFGYRTARSMKNEDTWEFAHHYMGKLWYVWGGVMLPLSTVAMLPVLGRDEDAVGSAGSIICIVQMLVIFITIGLTERALRKRYDKNGKPREAHENQAGKTE